MSRCTLGVVALLLLATASQAAPPGQVGRAPQVGPPPSWPTPQRQLLVQGEQTVKSLIASNVYRVCAVDAKKHWEGKVSVGSDGILVFGEPNKLHVLVPDQSCVDITGHSELVLYAACLNSVPQFVRDYLPSAACERTDGLVGSYVWISNAEVIPDHRAPFFSHFQMPNYDGGKKYYFANYLVIERPTPAKYEICTGGTLSVQIRAKLSDVFQDYTIQGCEAFSILEMKLASAGSGTYRLLK